MKLNLPIQLSKSDFYLKRPFIIFEIHNFIDNSDYDNLVREISSFNDYNHISKGRGKKEKITFTCRSFSITGDCSKLPNKECSKDLICSKT